MRFATIFWFLALLLLPSLVASKRESPPPPQYLPEHGDHVDYREAHGHVNTGIVVGTEHHYGGPLYVAPFGQQGAHTDRLVQIHNPGHVSATGHSNPTLASNIAREHSFNRPSISYGGGPLRRALRW